ncbi:MAG: [citrate (pro-3S)-lyase] ligase [Spirochaetia bacterium]|nr:[citrate (pro-3S)-lyase] ligase [Spirochaetia bacterium]
MDSRYTCTEIQGIQNDSRVWKELAGFLREQQLEVTGPPEHTVIIKDEGSIIATGSSKKNIIQYLAVSQAHRSEGLLAPILTALMRNITNGGMDRIFIYTSPENRELFMGFGFFPVAETADVLLLENREDGIRHWLEGISSATKLHAGELQSDGRVGAIVMNCDPFTRGHRYLIEYAAAGCALLHIFILSSGGTFTAEERYAMVEAGTADLENVLLHPASDYVVSPATFPTYFIKARHRTNEVSCSLDIELFSRKIAPQLEITVRFAGTEPYCPVTSEYNRQMARMLPDQGIEFLELPRFEYDGRAVSASEVRRLYHEHRWDDLKQLVPRTTWQILQGLPER